MRMAVGKGIMKGSGGGNRTKGVVLIIVVVTVLLAALISNQMINGPAYYCNSEFKNTGTCPDGCVERVCECVGPDGVLEALDPGAACYCCFPE
jgi:hypothetical protein